MGENTRELMVIPPSKAKDNLVQEVVTGDPKFDIRSDSLKQISFGNTGFSFWVDKLDNGSYNSHIDFTPEGSVSQHTKKSTKYSRIFAYSILRLYKLLNDPETESNFDITPARLGAIKVISSRNFVEKLTSFFHNHQADSLIKTYDRKDVLDIDAQAFMSLKPDNPFLKHLRKMSKPIEDGKVTVVNRKI